MKRPKYQEDSVDNINISPLIDVLFILLIFFIVTMVFSNRNALEIESPSASNATSAKDDAIFVSIDSKGGYYYDSQGISLEEFEKKCIDLLKTKKPVIMLQADAKASVQSLVSIIDMSKGLGIEEVYVVADKNNE